MKSPATGTEQAPPQRSPIVEERLRATARIRLRILRVVFLTAFLAVFIRLAQVQIVQVDKYKPPRNHYELKKELPPTRGNIYDRNSDRIATNSLYVSFGLDPQRAADSMRQISKTFSSLFKKPASYYRSKFDTTKKFVWLERHQDLTCLKKLERKKYPGIMPIDEPRRLYHNGAIAGQLIGTTNLDNIGIAGIELQYDSVLKGKSGYIILQKDGYGKSRAVVDYPRMEPENGHNIMLTIDLTVQAIVEEELKKGVSDHKADGGIAIVLEPSTGDILAMAQYPPVDPARFGKSPLKDQKLRAITDMFEPGSVFKVVTASAALESGLVSPDRKFNAEHGRYIVPGRPHPITDVHEYDVLSFREAIAHSSNIVMAKISDIIGTQRMFRMARDYGFGIPTNITLPGEEDGRLKRPSEWSGTTLNTIAYGYEVGVTPLQIALAYAAIANQGVLMKPRIFMKELDQENRVVREEPVQQIRRIVSPGTAGKLVSMLNGVVEYGTAKTAAISGTTVAGKTGTSRKFIDGSYQRNYAASFVGFFPVESPKVVCLVMLDIPREQNYTGGMTSAPVFRAIGERIITTTNYVPVQRPPMVDRNMTPATGRTAARTPVAAARSPRQTDQALKAGNVVPDLRGLAVRQAMNLLVGLRLRPEIRGSGTVVAQTPAAGSPVAPGMNVVLVCEPKSRATARVSAEFTAQKSRSTGAAQ